MTTQARFNGVVIAESDDTVIVENNHYFPVESVLPGILQPSQTTSICPWKGTASYYTVSSGGAVSTDAAWYYPEPKAAAAEIAGRVAFWREVEVSTS